MKSLHNIQESLDEIRNAYEAYKDAKIAKRRICAPMLTDYDTLPNLWQLFCDTIGKQDGGGTIDKQKFIFIVQYLYAPTNLFGEKMPRLLRHELTKITGIKSGSVITRYCRNSLFYYKNYAKFKNDVDRIFSEIVK